MLYWILKVNAKSWARPNNWRVQQRFRIQTFEKYNDNEDNRCLFPATLGLFIAEVDSSLSLIWKTRDRAGGLHGVRSMLTRARRGKMIRWWPLPLSWRCGGFRHQSCQRAEVTQTKWPGQTRLRIIRTLFELGPCWMLLVGRSNSTPASLQLFITYKKNFVKSDLRHNLQLNKARILNAF